MNFSETLNGLMESLGDTLPALLQAIAILIIGWIVAVVLRAAIRKGLGALNANERVKRSTEGKELDVENGTATIVFWVIMLFVLIAFFNALNLGSVSEPLQGILTKITEFLPNLVSALLLGIVAWFLATVIRAVATRALAATKLDDKVSTEAGMQPMSANLAKVLYWLIILLFLPAILGALELEGLLRPVQSMIDELLAMLPNVFGALIIGVVGYFVARILRDIVLNLLQAAGFDRLGERAGLTGKVGPSRLVAMLVFIFVFVPALIAALNALKIEAISAPATDMLHAFMEAIPNIFAAAIILAVAWVLARFVAQLLENLLDGLGFDQLPARLGLGALAADGFSLSRFAARVVMFFIMLFAVVEASNRLGFEQVADIVATLIEFGGQVLLGSVILLAGFWIANFVRDAMLRVSGPDAATLAGIVRVAILGLVAAMGLRAMGIADDIVELAFALTLGAVAVAVALSFGLGGREAAGRQMEYWLSRLRKGP